MYNYKYAILLFIYTSSVQLSQFYTVVFIAHLPPEHSTENHLATGKQKTWEREQERNGKGRLKRKSAFFQGWAAQHSARSYS